MLCEVVTSVLRKVNNRQLWMEEMKETNHGKIKREKRSQRFRDSFIRSHLS